jgi:hypothetical protein
MARIIGARRPSVVYQTTVFGSVNAASYSPAGVAIGAEAATRLVIVGVGCSHLTADLTPPSSVTINGNAAVQLVTSGSASASFSLWAAVVPTGTTATIVVTRSANMGHAEIHVWSAYNLQVGVIDAQIISGNPAAGTLAVADNGVAVGHSFNSGGTYTVAGLVEDAEGNGVGTGSSARWVAASAQQLTAPTLGVTFTFTAGGCTAAIASFR